MCGAEATDPTEVGSINQRSFDFGVLEPGFGEDRAAQVGVLQIHLFQDCTGEVTAFQPSVLQVDAGQLAAAKVADREPALCQVAVFKRAISHREQRQVRATKVDLAQSSALHVQQGPAA
ncbi:MAG: hypothetical protein CMP23_12915 [Rickettsiales bacterium]|nr:hypothetical protein [Rickettsiales bacterium]